ncbi:hypothetical protein D3C84_295280 [compost metagenome]
MRESIQNALATGFKETLEGRRVGQGVGRRHRLGQQVDDELATAGILIAEVAATDPVVHFPTPGQVSPHVTTIQRVALPGWLIETLVPRRRLEFRTVEQDVFQFHAERSHVSGAVHGLLQHLLQDHASAAEYVAPARAERWIQAKRVLGGLQGELFIIFIHCDTPCLTLGPLVARGLDRFVEVTRITDRLTGDARLP